VLDYDFGRTFVSFGNMITQGFHMLHHYFVHVTAAFPSYSVSTAGANWLNEPKARTVAGDSLNRFCTAATQFDGRYCDHCRRITRRYCNNVHQPDQGKVGAFPEKQIILMG
jgi:hypothetical protein